MERNRSLWLLECDPCECVRIEKKENKRITFFPFPFILRSVSLSSRSLAPTLLPPLISLFAKSFEDSETSFPVMRYIRRRNLEHHSEAINLLAALQATMHFFFFLLFFFVFDRIRVFLRHDRAMLGKSSMDIGRFVEWDNFLFINQNYKQGFQQVRTVL